MVKITLLMGGVVLFLLAIFIIMRKGVKHKVLLAAAAAVLGLVLVLIGLRQEADTPTTASPSLTGNPPTNPNEGEGTDLLSKLMSGAKRLGAAFSGKSDSNSKWKFGANRNSAQTKWGANQNSAQTKWGANGTSDKKTPSATKWTV